MYKQASKLKLRFNTTRGVLTVEQLWSLSVNELVVIIKSLKKEIKKDNDDELSFLDDNIVIDEKTVLQFDIVKDIYLTKKAELEAKSNAYNKKQELQKLLEIKAKRDEESLEKISDDKLNELINQLSI